MTVMSNSCYRCIALSTVKHDYLARAVHSHPSFELVVVADDPQQPQWVHERNNDFAAEFNISYVRSSTIICATVLLAFRLISFTIQSLGAGDVRNSATLESSVPGSSIPFAAYIQSISP